MTLEEQLAEQAKKGLLGLGLEQETAEEYAPWASLLAQFIPGVGEGVGIDNTVDAIQDERYGDAAIEGGLTLLGAVPVVGDFAAAAIKGIRKAPVKALDDWGIPDRPIGLPRKLSDMNPDQLDEYRHWKKLYQAGMARKRRAEKGDHINSLRRQRHADNPERANSANRKRYAEDEDFRERQKKSALQWEQDNPELAAAKKLKRRAAENQRVVAWADNSKIREIYRTAAEVSAETGIPHHVDHVIPLRGRNVSGLHHQDNLLVVPGAENLSKSNKFEPGDLPPRAGVRKSRAYLKKLKEAQEAARRK